MTIRIFNKNDTIHLIIIYLMIQWLFYFSVYVSIYIFLHAFIFQLSVMYIQGMFLWLEYVQSDI